MARIKKAYNTKCWSRHRTETLTHLLFIIIIIIIIIIIFGADTNGRVTLLVAWQFLPKLNTFHLTPWSCPQLFTQEKLLG